MTTWERNDIQFPRLLAEVLAAGLSDEQYKAICESMDLNQDQVDELFKRAEMEWEKIKDEIDGSYHE